MTAILLVAGLTLFTSFMCSLFEAALYAVSPAQVETVAAAGRFGGRRLKRMRDRVEEPIAAILSVNTIANTAGAAWFGSLVGQYYGTAGSALAIGTGVLTFAILLVSEIIPKSLGVRYAKRLGPLIAWPLQVMVWAAWPVVKATSFLMKILMGSSGPAAPSEDEVEVLARLAAQVGAVRSQEHRWVRNALALDTVKAKDVMTPRTVVRFLSADLRIADLDPKERTWTHSRVPVAEGGNLDKIIGIVYRKHVLDALLAGDKERRLRDMVRPIEFVPETMPGHKLLDKLVREQVHLAAVVDEYGGIEGIVTLEDVLESLIGSEIIDEHDEVPDMQQLARDLATDAAAEREPGPPPQQPERPAPSEHVGEQGRDPQEAHEPGDVGDRREDDRG